MKPEQWPQVEQVYHAALELPSNERAAYVAQACAGDAVLRREVESLLGYDAQAADFIEQPAIAVAAQDLAEEQSTMQLGQRISHYQILSRLGAGGMGEVFLAQDTSLNRQVALKLLPRHSTAVAERVQRFEREARAASALNHPNILTIHEIGQVSTEAGETHFIVTEYVEGQTLRQRMKTARMSLPDSLDVAMQIASALAAAHAAGIIHRDIKPENVMVRPDGLVKVLDFGLAKLTEQSSGGEADAEAARVTTEAGVVRGTPRYMSPEQARGLKVDARTDIFSLGVMLYEMVAGHRPFESATTSDVIAAILTAEPAPLSQHAPESPPELERIVAKALRKDREERYQVVKELLVDLKDLKQELELEAKPGHADRGKTNAAARSTSSAEYLLNEIQQHKRGVILALATLLVVGAGIVYWLFQLIGQPKPAAPRQTMEIRRLTQTGKATRAAISPDGKYVAHVMEEAGRQSLWLRHVATNSDTQIVPPAEVNYRSVTFSPDGNFIYYVRGKPRDPTGEFLDISGVLYKTTILGKDEKKLTEKVRNSISLSPDGKRIAFVRSYPGEEKTVLIVANVDGTGEQELATRQGLNTFAGDGGVAWSPDGKIIACAHHSVTPFYRNVIGVRVADGVEIPITSHKWSGVIKQVTWLPDGSGLLVVGVERIGLSQQIWHLSYPGDQVQKVTNDLSSYEDLSLTADSGTLATVQADQLINVWIAPGGDASRAKQLTSGAGRSDGGAGLAWTPDGKIVYSSIAGGGSNVWIMEADGTGNKKLSFNDPANFTPAVSPDGRYIVWSAARPTSVRHIWRMDIDSGNPKQLTNGSGEWGPQYSPNGKWLVYRSENRVWKMLADGGTPVPLTSRASSSPTFSPDGKLIAFNLMDEGSVQCKIAVMPFEGGPPIKVFDIPGGFFRPIGWTPDGRAVAYPVYRGGVSNIWAQPLDGGPPKQLTYFREGQIFDFAWSRDGKQLALSRGLINSDVVLINNLR